MKYDELMIKSKKVFDYHPDQKFDGLEDLLRTAQRQFRWRNSYELGASIIAGYAARYIDERENNDGDKSIHTASLRTP